MGKFNILVKRLGALGDVILTIPAIRGLKEKYPQCQISFLTFQNNGQIIQGHPLIDKIICPGKAIDYSKYDLFFDLEYESRPYMHMIDAYCQGVGVKPSNKELSIVLRQPELDFAKNYLNDHHLQSDQILIGLHSGGSSWPCKLWGLDNFGYVLRFFQENFGFRIIELGAKDCQPLGLDMNLINQTSIKQAAAILKNCDLFLGVDSGLLHVAAAVNTPIVAVFGCTDPDKVLPFETISLGIQSQGKCTGCRHWPPFPRTFTRCSKERIFCLEEISRAEVIEGVWTILMRAGKLENKL